MQKSSCFYLGKIIKKHGFKGELIVKLDTDEPELYNTLESAYIELDGMLVPFFFTKCSVQHNGNLRISIEDVGEEEVDRFIGKGVYLPLEVLPQLADDQFYYHEVVGYKVEDQQYGFIGTIDQVNDSGPQAFFEITHPDGKQILLPILDEFIIRLDKEAKTFYVLAPAGLIELYLG